MTNNLLLPGGGLEFGETISLSRSSLMRVERAAETFHEDFMSHGSKIYCTGAYPTLPAGAEIPSPDYREGTLMADRLMNVYHIPSSRIEVDTEATSTATNVVTVSGMIAADQGVRIEEILSPEAELGVVSRKKHIQRIKGLLGQLGCATEYVQPIVVHEDGGKLYDSVSSVLFQASLLGVNGDIQKLLRRDRKLESVNDRMRTTLGGVKKLVR